MDWNFHKFLFSKISQNHNEKLRKYDFFFHNRETEFEIFVAAVVIRSFANSSNTCGR